MKRLVTALLRTFTPLSAIMIAKVKNRALFATPAQTARNPSFSSKRCPLRRFLARFSSKVGVFYAAFWPASSTQAAGSRLDRQLAAGVVLAGS